MQRSGKPIHIDSNLRHQAAGRHIINARNALPQRQSLLKAEDLLVYLLFQAHSFLLEPVPVFRRIRRYRSQLDIDLLEKFLDANGDQSRSGVVPLDSGSDCADPG